MNFPISKIIGQRLRALRIRSGLTEQETCNKLQMTEGSFSKLEEGNIGIPLWRLEEIAQFFTIDLYDLLKKEGVTDNDVSDLTEEVASLAKMNMQQSEEIIRLQRKVMQLYSDRM